MLRVGLLAACLFAAATVAVAATPSSLRTVTAVCPTRVFTVSFDPKRQVVVTDGEGALASASFSARTISSRCRRVAGPSTVTGGGIGPAIRTRTSFRCLAPQPIRIRVDPIGNGGSGLMVGVGSRFRLIVSAVLEKKGDPSASRVRRAAAYCKLGA